MGANKAFDVNYIGEEVYNLFSKDAIEYFKEQVPGYDSDGATIEVTLESNSTPPTKEFFFVKVKTILVRQVEYGVSTTIEAERTYGYEASLFLIVKEVLQKAKIELVENLNTNNRKNVKFQLGNVMNNRKKDESVISFTFSLIYTSNNA